MMLSKSALEQLPDLVETVRAGVVHVEFASQDGTGNGSGFLIEPLPGDPAQGVVVTNAHVARGATQLWVRLNDGREAEAEVRLCDDSTDLALLNIPLVANKTLPMRKLARLRVGEFVIAMGSPYGMEGTVTVGIVSGLDRTMPAPNRVPIENMIETDALINPGNSGGPLIGLDGFVVGVNDQTILSQAGGASGLGFAIPCDTVGFIYEEIVETRKDYVVRASLSTRTTLRAFSFDERRRFAQKAGALLVAAPPPASPADQAGLQKGDIIVSFNEVTVDEPGDLFSALTRHVIGKTCQLAFLRDEERHSVSVVPRERPVTVISKET